MPYGWRIVQAWLIGALLAAGWLFAAWAFFEPNDEPGAYWGAIGVFAPFGALAAYGALLLVGLGRVLPELGVPRGTAWGHRLLIQGAGVVFFVAVFGAWGYAGYKASQGQVGQQLTWQEDEQDNGAVIRLVSKGVAYGAAAFLILAIPPLLVHVIEAHKENPTLRRWFLSGRGGSSRWAGPATLNRHERRLSRAGRVESVYLGRSLFEDDFAPRHIAARDDSHLLTIGTPGSGKSVSAIWPNLLNYHGHAIVIDPKGEHARMTLGRRQKFKQYSRVEWRQAEEVNEAARMHGLHSPQVAALEEELWQIKEHHGTPTRDVTRCKAMDGYAWVLDPFKVVGVYPSACYNLLSEIRLDDHYARTMISAISKSCITVHHGENKFWEESARLVLDGAIAHVLSTRPKEEHNLPAVADLLLGRDPETGFADEDRLKETLIDMRMNEAVGGLPQRAAMLFDNLGEKAYGNITAELLNALKWCTDPAMRAILTRSSFSFGDLRYGASPMTIYISIPFAAMVEQARWLRCLTEIAMQAALRNREKERRPDPPILFVLDELPQYGKDLPGIKEGMVTLRDAGMKLWPFVQNYQQLIDCFGEEGVKNFESGATVQVLGVNDASTAAWIANKLGKHRITRRAWRRWGWLPFRKTVGQEETALVDAATVVQELQKNSRLQYVFPSVGRPMRLERMAFKALSIEGERLREAAGYAEADEHLGPGRASKAVAERRQAEDASRRVAPERMFKLRPPHPHEVEGLGCADMALDAFIANHVAWRVGPGDVVKRGDEIGCLMPTGKAILRHDVSILSPVDGVVHATIRDRLDQGSPLYTPTALDNPWMIEIDMGEDWQRQVTEGRHESNVYGRVVEYTKGSRRH